MSHCPMPAELEQVLEEQPDDEGQETLSRHQARSNQPLSVEQILAWADEHQARTGQWPTTESGAVACVPGEHWRAIHEALRHGWRGLPGGDSLQLLLTRHHRKSVRRGLAPLTEAQILAWVDAHQRRTGHWPNANSGPVLEAPGENWRALNMALRAGNRGLPGSDSLARLLNRHRRRRRTR
jgi:pyrroloquinoline quinone (PQQ) biosynthesis protein C